MVHLYVHVCVCVCVRECVVWLSEGMCRENEWCICVCMFARVCIHVGIQAFILNIGLVVLLKCFEHA